MKLQRLERLLDVTKVTNIILAGFAVFLVLNAGCYAGTAPLKKTQEPLQKEAGSSLVWDFGQVKEGDVVGHVFIVTNTTDKTFHINSVNTSCGCTASEIKKKELRPGESTELEVKFNSKGYHGDISQHVYVNTDGIEQPVIKFTIKAEVVKEGN